MRRLRRALLFAQYLRTLGGGERVMIALAEVLAEDFQVVIFAPRLPSRERWEAFGLPEGLDVRQADARQFAARTVRADLVVAMSNHVPLLSLARRSLLVAQFPYDDVRIMSPARRLWSNRVLRSYDLLTYSAYSAEHITQRWCRGDAVVVAPPVRLRRYEQSRKERLILSVGRLGGRSHPKRHDVLIDAFGRLGARAAGWELVIAGGGSANDPGVRRLMEHAGHVGATVLPDIDEARMDDLLHRASLYWHAAGYGRPPDGPELAEHFGMSTVEAMSAGAVPLVFRDGGSAELVDESVGVAWRTTSELIEATCRLIASSGTRNRLASAAVARAQRYGLEPFRSHIRSLVYGGRRAR